MKRIRLTAWVLAIAVLVAAGWAWQRRSPAPVPAARPPLLLELAAADLARATEGELAESVGVSGSLRAVRSATVRARAAGEVQLLSVREGEAVAKGQVVAQVDPADGRSRLAQAREQADAARAQVEMARRQYDNNRALVDQGFISRTALDTSRAQLAAAEASHRAALASVDLAARAMEDTVLRAPIAGVVSQRLVQPGERVGIDTRILELVDPARLELEASLTPADSMRVRTGQPALLQVEGTGEPVQARVERINPAAQPGSRSVLAYLALTADRPDLRPGLFAQGQVTTARTRATLVPLSAVRTDKPRPYVQVLQEERVAHLPLEPGARTDRDGETWVAAAGVPPGAWVLRGHVGPLPEGTAVRMPAPSRP